MHATRASQECACIHVCACIMRACSACIHNGHACHNEYGHVVHASYVHDTCMIRASHVHHTCIIRASYVSCMPIHHPCALIRFGVVTGVFMYVHGKMRMREREREEGRGRERGRVGERPSKRCLAISFFLSCSEARESGQDMKRLSAVCACVKGRKL